MGNQCNGSSRMAEAVLVAPEDGPSRNIPDNRRLGWKKDLPDFRDRILVLPRSRKMDLPPKVDLRPKEHFPVYDQGDLGSCTAQALGAAFHFDQIKQGILDFAPSRLFIYYNERAMEDSVEHDNGAQLRDGVKCLNQLGVCNENMWPYDTAKFVERPTSECYVAALPNSCLEYARVPQTLDDLKGCINEGLPFVFGFVVCSTFFIRQVSETGVMIMPLPDDAILGGHAVMAIGYDDERRVFIVRNSWGDSWGDAGYFYMPYDYISQNSLATDFWVMKTVEGQCFPTRRM